METKALKAKRPGFTDDRYKETAYYVENGKFYSKIFFGLFENIKKKQNLGISYNTSSIQKYIFYFRPSQSISLLLYIYNVYQRQMGWRENFGSVWKGV